MALVTVAIRNDAGEIVGTYQVPSGGGAISRPPQNIIDRFYDNTGHRIRSGYKEEAIIAPDASQYYQREIEQGKLNTDLLKYQDKIDALQKEASDRRSKISSDITEKQSARDSAVTNANTLNRWVAHTTNNPFVASGAREFTRRKAKAGIDNLLSLQSGLDNSVSDYNLLTFEGQFGEYEKQQAQRIKNYDSGLLSMGGKDNKYIDYNNYTPPVSVQPPSLNLNERRAAESVAAYQQEKQGIPNYSSGITIENPLGGYMTRAEAEAYNKNLIASQLEAKENINKQGLKQAFDAGQLGVKIALPSVQYSKVQPTNEQIFENVAQQKKTYDTSNARNESKKGIGYIGPASPEVLVQLKKSAEQQNFPNAKKEVEDEYNRVLGLNQNAFTSTKTQIKNGIETTQYSPSVQKQTLEKITPQQKIAPAQMYVITDKNGNIQRQMALSDDEIRAYQNIGSTVAIENITTRYKVKDPTGRERIFDTKEGADKFSSNYGGKIIPVQGSVQPNGIAGSLTSIYGVTPPEQGPNLGNAFFVGANAEGYTIEAKKPIEQSISTSDIFGSNPVTRGIDTFFDLNKPVSQRGNEIGTIFNSKGIGFSNRQIGELSAPFLNRAAEAKDVFAATPGYFRGEKTFTTEPGLFGIPQTVPVKRTAKIETTLDKLAQGKPIDLSNENERFSLYGSAFEIGGELYAFGKGVQGGTKGIEAIDFYKNTGALTKAGAVKKAERLLNEGLISGATKVDENTFVLAVGGGGKGTGISTEIKPTLRFEKIKDTVTSVFSKTPKEVNVLQSGEKIQQEIDSIDRQIEKLKVFTDSNRFDKDLVQRTNEKINDLIQKREGLRQQSSVMPGEAKYPVSIIEFNRPPTPNLPTGNNIIQIGKAVPIAETKIGSTIFVEGTVPRQNLLDIGLVELPNFSSKEFGIATSQGQTNAIYQGIVTESNFGKLVAAEKLGAIKTIAQGKSAPLEYLLKGKTDLLREYAGVNTKTTNIEKPLKFSWRTFKKEPEIFDPFKIPKPVKNIQPEISVFAKTKPDEIRTPTEFGIVNTGPIKSGETRGVTGIGSKSLKNFEQDILNPFKESESSFKKSRPFKFDIVESRGGAGSSGKSASMSLDEALGAAKTHIRANIPVEPQDILFSGPRGLLPQYHGVLSDNVLAFPQGTPERIKNQIKIDTGLDTSSRQKQSQIGEGDYFKRFGLETIGQTKKEFEKQDEIDIFIHTPKEGQKEKIGGISITGLGLGLGVTPIYGMGLDITPKQDLETTPITELTTIPITDIITEPVPEKPYTGFELGKFGIGFPGFGIGGGGGTRPKRYKKKYLVSSIDPLNPGSIVTAGVREQQISSSKSIYGKIDVQLNKARKKNNPKQKKSKHAIPDPFG